MAYGSAEAAYKVEDKESLRPPHILQYPAKHPQCQHIKAYVHHCTLHIIRVAVHENMCKRLPPFKQWRGPVMQSKVIAKVNARFAQGKLQ